jgi:hypothetical protein
MVFNPLRLRFHVFSATASISHHYSDTDIIHNNTYIHSRFIPEGVVEVSQIFLRDTHVLLKLVSYEEHCRRDRW